MHDFDEIKIMEKFNTIKEQYIDTYTPDPDIERGDTKYLKYNEVLDYAFDRFISPHIEKGKILYKKERKSIPKNSDPREYYELVYDKEGNLHHSEFEMGRAGFLANTLLGATNSKIIEFCISKNLWVECMMDCLPSGKVKFSWMYFEWAEYDDAGRLISVESFKNDISFSGGVIVNAEYYDHEGGVLSHITRYKDYYSDIPNMIRNSVAINMPDRIYNPDVINYSFEKSDDDIVCTRQHYFRVSQTITHEITIPDKEVQKMETYGIKLR